VSGGLLNLGIFRTDIFSTILSPEASESRDFANLTPKFSFNFGTSWMLRALVGIHWETHRFASHNDVVFIRARSTLILARVSRY
jgi:hypothetical protein